MSYSTYFLKKITNTHSRLKVTQSPFLHKTKIGFLTKNSLKLSVDVKFTDKILSNTWMWPRMIRRIMQIKEGEFSLGVK